MTKIRSKALQQTLSSPFWTLFNSNKHDDAIIKFLCGFDHASFKILYQVLQSEFNNKEVGLESCVPLVVWHLDWHGLLVVPLWCIGLQCNLRFLEGFIEVVEVDNCKVHLTNEEAIVQLPRTSAETALSASMMNQKYTLLTKNCWGAMESLKLTPLQWTGEHVSFYNGWTYEHYVKNLSLFSWWNICFTYFHAPGWCSSQLNNGHLDI